MQDFLKDRPHFATSGGAKPTINPTGATGRQGGESPVFDAGLLNAMHAAHTGQGGAHEISVEAIKEGDRVTKLIVTCRCGERIEILCAYGPTAR